MGISRASKDLLLNVGKKVSDTATKGVLAVGNVGVKAHDKIMSALEENKRLNDQAAAAMDKKYPGGWTMTPTTNIELNQIRRNLKNK